MGGYHIYVFRSSMTGRAVFIHLHSICLCEELCSGFQQVIGEVWESELCRYLPPAGQIVLIESVLDLHIAIDVHFPSNFLLVGVERYALKLISSRTDLISNITFLGSAGKHPSTDLRGFIATSKELAPFLFGPPALMSFLGCLVDCSLPLAGH